MHCETKGMRYCSGGATASTVATCSCTLAYVLTRASKGVSLVFSLIFEEPKMAAPMSETRRSGS
jgi:hypothetical protein